MKRAILISSLILMLSHSLFAGKYAADFLRIGVGARAAAMGNAFTAVANDAAAFYWNPAGLPGAGLLAGQIDHVPMFNGLAHYNVATGMMALRHNITVAAGWIRLGVDDIPRYAPLVGERTDRLNTGANRSTGQNLGYFADAEDAVLVAIGKKVKFDLGLGRRSNMLVLPMELSVGLTGKFIHHKLDDKTGAGQGLDAGLLLRAVSRKKDRREAVSWLGLGLAARDLSRTSITWNTMSNHQDRVETGLILGLAGSHYFDSFTSRLTIAIDQEMTPYQDTHLGVEFAFLHVAALRAGIWEDSFSAGAGLTFRNFRLDYAFVTHDLGNSHRVSGGVGF